MAGGSTTPPTSPVPIFGARDLYLTCHMLLNAASVSARWNADRVERFKQKAQMWQTTADRPRHEVMGG